MYYDYLFDADVIKLYSGGGGGEVHQTKLEERRGGWKLVNRW